MSLPFNEVLRATRRATIDPLTGKPMSQRRVAELVEAHVQTVIGWERPSGRLPDHGHRRALLRLWPGLFGTTTY